jgi:putative effector of murein hydrolase
LSSALALIGLTLAVFAGATWLYQKSRRLAFLQPVLIAITLLSLLLGLTHFPYQTYFEATRPLHILLGPAIVALAVPLYENLRKARDILVPVLGTVAIGGSLVITSALGLGLLFGLTTPMEVSLITKSVTAPIALAVADKIGGIVPLTVPLTLVGVFTTGILGTVITPLLLRWTSVRDPRICGFTLGLTSHGFGIARSIEYGPEAVTFATLGMALMGCAVAILVPIGLRFF